MKQRQICSPRLLWLCGLAIVVTACDNNSNPVSPSAMLEPLGARVTVCHRTGGGTFMLLEVSASAYAGHMSHGDGMPNTEGYDGNCAARSSAPPPPPPPPDPLPLTLACGAPAGATNPGSTVFPGPTVNATQGATLQFLVTASPAPASDTWMVREIRDTRPSGLTVVQSNVLLSNGSYQGSIFTSTLGSFLREIRFTLDGASCSLFWSINQ